MFKAVITGRIGGNGFIVASRLHEHGPAVITIGRDADRGTEAPGRESIS